VVITKSKVFLIKGLGGKSEALLYLFLSFVVFYL